MKPGDLVRFSDDGTWTSDSAGRIGIVTAMRPVVDDTSKTWKFFFDAIVDGSLKTGYGYLRKWDNGIPPVEVIDEAG